MKTLVEQTKTRKNYEKVFNDNPLPGNLSGFGFGRFGSFRASS